MNNKKDEKEKQNKTPLLKRLLKFAHGYQYFMYASMILSAVSAVVVLFVAVFVWKGANAAIYSYPNFDVIEIKRYAWFAVGCAIGSILIYVGGLLCSHCAAFRIAANMRIETLNHLMNLPLGYFTNTGSGKMKRIIDDSSAATEIYLAHQLPDLVCSFATAITVLVLLFIFNVKLGIASLVPMVLSFLVIGITMIRNYKERLEQYQSVIERMNNEAVEYIRAIPVVKTFAQSLFSFKKFYDIIDEYRDLAAGMAKNMRMAMVVFQTLIVSIVSFLVIFGVPFIMNSGDTKEFFSKFLFYVFFSSTLTTMLARIMWTSSNTLLAEDALNRIEALLNEKPLPIAENPQTPKGSDIVLKDVGFSYPNTNSKTLENININIKQGTTVALVGSSGGGKSTIASLIARFWDVDSGSITIGGVDLRNISEECLMNNISFVFQHTNLYKESILENVRESKPDATVEEVMLALKHAQCDDIINKLPDGINTVIGTKGTYLSGGEQQRIVIARAILKDAPIILLDEATAFADPENEYKIRLAFEGLTKNKSVLMIAHRLSTIENADYIYVIENGQIIEHGTHGDLINSKNEYASMWDEYKQTLAWS